MCRLPFFVLLIFILHFAKSVSEHPARLPRQDRLDGSEIVRLPTNLIPLNYALDIRINLPGYGANIPREAEFTTEGHLICEFEVLQEPTTQIQLHVGNYLQIRDISVTSSSSKDEELSIDVNRDTEYNQEAEILAINVPHELSVSQVYNVSISFRGVIFPSGKGLFYGSYGNEYYAVTSFEATYARAMTPCFDEPSFKAYWDVRVIHPDGTHAVSNGQLLDSVKLTGDERTFIQSTFATSPYMSSYLLAILVSNFESEIGYTKDGRMVRGFADRSMRNPLLKNAVEYSIRTIEILEELFEIQPISNKSDFAFVKQETNGMENWNLITYSEVRLTGPEADSDSLIHVIVHELTHQWLGNLVTAEWWNELWLNEGLTTYVTCIVQEKIGNLPADECFSEKQTESLDETEFPLVPEVEIRYDVNGQRQVVYNKGCSFMRMIQELVGQHNLFESLKAYLRKHAYQNAETSDLIAEIQPFINTLDMTKFSEQWTKQIGYPIVIVEQIDEYSYRLTQRSYPYNTQALFDIPIFSDNILEGKSLMLTDDMPELIVTTHGGYPIINAYKAGSYRVDFVDGWQDVLSQDLPDLVKHNIEDHWRFFQGHNNNVMHGNIQEPPTNFVPEIKINNTFGFSK